MKQLESAPNVQPLDSDDEPDGESDAELLHRQHGTDADSWAWNVTMEKYRERCGKTIEL